MRRDQWQIYGGRWRRGDQCNLNRNNHTVDTIYGILNEVVTKMKNKTYN